MSSPEDDKNAGKRGEEEKRAELFGNAGTAKKKGLMGKFGFGGKK